MGNIKSSSIASQGDADRMMEMTTLTRSFSFPVIFETKSTETKKDKSIITRTWHDEEDEDEDDDDDDDDDGGGIWRL